MEPSQKKEDIDLRLLHGSGSRFSRDSKAPHCLDFGCSPQHRKLTMVIVTFIMALATAAFYGAGNYGIGADKLCYYGATFCVHPHWLGIATLLLVIWTLFLRVDRI